MADIPPAARQKAHAAANAYADGERLPVHLLEAIADEVLEAAAPLLAETVAQKITEHMENFGPRKPRGPLETSLNGISAPYRAWRRHFGIAARIAAGAFDTREDQLRKAAEAIERGDFIACRDREVPSERA